MLIQIILSLLLGTLAGTATGLIPGIHINLIGVFLISLSATYLAKLNQIYLIVFITAMAITHTFLDFIPSIFLGCPDTDTELSILPGHELLKQGHGYQAIILTAYGSLAAIIILLILAYPAIKLIPFAWQTIQNIIPYILTTASLFLILTDKNKMSATFIFALTGILGILILNPNQILGKGFEFKEPLLPLLTGLFGSSSLLLSIKNKTKIPEQTIALPKTKLTRPIMGALMASPLCSFLPGLGSGQAAIIGNAVTKNSQKQFLVLLGATNTLVMGFSMLSLYAIAKTRSGAAYAINKILPALPGKILVLILVTILFSGIISFFLTFFIAKVFAANLPKFNYEIISSATLIILAAVVAAVSGLTGLAVLIVATATGIYCIGMRARRTNMMGCLLVPTILFYLF